MGLVEKFTIDFNNVRQVSTVDKRRLADQNINGEDHIQNIVASERPIEGFQSTDQLPGKEIELTWMRVAAACMYNALEALTENHAELLVVLNTGLAAERRHERLTRFPLRSL